jgi:hypothetical protein
VLGRNSVGRTRIVGSMTPAELVANDSMIETYLGIAVQ